MKRTTVLIWAILGVWPAGALPAPPDTAAREIEHLLDHLGASRCDFNRNGKWFPSEKAREHLRKKYDYLVKKKLVASAEQFIERAGTESSQSGQPYRVRCAGQETAAADWLNEELRRYRSHTERR